jgi:tRNA A37 threonylcarbamoyladenosine dehydratase
MAFDKSRGEALLGQRGIERLANAHVAVFGVGGVGGHLCEALVRSGVGEITVVDGDTVAPSNLNRQIIALESNIGRSKVEVMAERIADINPDCKVHALHLFYLPENADSVNFDEFDFVADAVDTVAAKVDIICRATTAGVPVISSMGAGNKLYPERFRVSDIYETSVCPLARVMRKQMKDRGITSLPVVWSDEPPLSPSGLKTDGGEVRRSTPGSLAFVPSAAGLLMAGYIVRQIAFGEK